MKSRLGLQTRLILLIMAAILPLALASVIAAVREQRAATEQTQTQLKLAASLVAANQDRLVESTRDLLAAVALMPTVRARNQVQCEAYFASLRARIPIYFNIGLLRMDGSLVCHAAVDRGDFNVGRRPDFQRALASRTFVMGQAGESNIPGRRTLPFALALTEGDTVTGVLFASIDLQSASAALMRLDLPQGARVVVADKRGDVLMEHPTLPTLSTIRTLVSPDLRQAARDMVAAVGEGADSVGEMRVWAAAPTRTVADEGLLAVVSHDADQVASRALDNMWRQLALLGLTLLAGTLAAWWLGRRAIVGPARQVIGAVRQFERGDLDARVALSSQQRPGEFARIGAAFNLMAESLQLRQLDLQSELRRSRDAYAVLELVIRSMQDGLLAVDNQGKLIMSNELAERLFSADASPPPQDWPRRFGLYQADGQTLFVASELPLARAMRGESGRDVQMFVRNPSVPEGRLIQCSYQPMRSEGAIRGGLLMFTDVTELQRLQTEQAAQFGALRETQRKLVEAQRIGRIGNWELDVRSARLWWSDEVYALFDVRPQDFGGTDEAFVQYVHPGDRERVGAMHADALQGLVKIDMEYRALRPDGREVWLYEIGELRRDAQGAAESLTGVVQDITARKQSGLALLQRERELAQFTAMLQRAAEAAQAINRQRSMQQTMDELAAQARSVLGARLAMVAVAADGDWRRARTAMSVADSLATFRRRPPAPDGSGIYALVAELGRPLRLTHAELLEHPRFRGFGGLDAGHPPMHGLLALSLNDRAGRQIGILMLSDKEQGEFTERDEYVALELAQLSAIAIDNARLFSEIRELNAGLEARIAARTAELAQQEARFRALAEQAPEIIWNLDPRGRLIYVNNAWSELVGGTAEDWLGGKWRSRIHPEDMPEVARNWERSRESMRFYAGTRRILAKDGSWHTTTYRGAPVFDAHGEVVFWVGIDSDITELKGIEQALRASNQELEAFSYSVSHDLRAPLGAIGGFSRALANKLEGQGDERVSHFLARIQAGVNKMEQLIDALLGLSKVVRAPLRYGPVDLSALAHEAIEALQEQQPERLVQVQVQDGLTAQGDAHLLRGVLENLLGNAWKFTSQTPAARIEVGLLERSTFYVRDNGVGFDMAYADKLFGAFQRLHTEAQFPGTGIGLATVQRIIARHQGRVWAESVPGEGTTFYFTLSESAPPPWLGAGTPGG